MAQTKHDAHIYGEVNSLEDLRRINQEIRRDMDAVTRRDQLTELKKRSDYLCTLTEAPSWQEKFGQQIHRMQQVAQEEDAKTTPCGQITRTRLYGRSYGKLAAAAFTLPVATGGSMQPTDGGY